MESGDAAWVMVSAALVLFMTPGLAFFYGGMDRSRNVLNMLMMNFWCLLTIPILWVVIGFSLAQGGGLRLNDLPESDPARLVTAADLNPDGVIKLAAGKKKIVLIKPV